MAEESRKGGGGSAALPATAGYLRTSADTDWKASSPAAGYLRASADTDWKASSPANPPPVATGAATAATSGPKKITLKSADMKDEMRQEAFDCARGAFEKYTVERDIAEYIKKEFDKNHGPTWHCIVGRNFGSYVTHETSHFIYFYVDSKAVLLFKSG